MGDEPDSDRLRDDLLGTVSGHPRIGAATGISLNPQWTPSLLGLARKAPLLPQNVLLGLRLHTDSQPKRMVPDVVPENDEVGLRLEVGGAKRIRSEILAGNFRTS